MTKVLLVGISPLVKSVHRPISFDVRPTIFDCDIPMYIVIIFYQACAMYHDFKIVQGRIYYKLPYTDYSKYFVNTLAYVHTYTHTFINSYTRVHITYFMYVHIHKYLYT